MLPKLPGLSLARSGGCPADADPSRVTHGPRSLPSAEGVAQRPAASPGSLLKMPGPHSQRFLFNGCRLHFACFLNFNVLRNLLGTQVIHRLLFW